MRRVETYKHEELDEESSEELEKISETSCKHQDPIEPIENVKESQEPLPTITHEAAISETNQATQLKS